tara:strand:- start:389 stop:631 length:243 start_codon:yes stop_codon:yes gene_type:complete
MTLRLPLGCNLVSLLGIASTTLWWRVVRAVVTILVVAVGLVVCLRLQLLYHLVLRTQLLLVLVAQRVLVALEEPMALTQS